ncbi:MAG: molybdopterin oxidoreductase, partial [bacterium]
MTIRNDKRARHYWRSLSELSDSEDFRREDRRGHHDAHSSERTELDRRSFLTLMGASMALAGLAGCRRPIEKIVPYVDQPENVIPGVPKFYATTMPRGNSALGLIVETHEGRPTKIEGNPGHPASRGSTDFFAQAEILALYDPDRSRSPYLNGEPAKYEDFVKGWAELAKTYEANNGQGLAILSESYACPTLARLRREFEKKNKKASWTVFDPLSNETELAAARAVTEKDVRPVYHVDKAKVILALDSDFLQHHPDNVLYSRGFADGRRVESTKDDMNRLYVIESGLSVTGGMADHRLRVPSSRSGGLVRALADRMRKPLDLNGAWPPAQPSGEYEDWLIALADDLLANRGQSLIIVGERQPQWVHELALTLNANLGNIGSTIELREVEDAGLSSVGELKNLTARMKDGQISTLIMLGGNPVYNAPADMGFATALKKVKTTVHLSSHRDETSKAVNWHLPRAHFLESWSDCRAVDGTMSLVQPMIEPLHQGHTCIELLSTLLTGTDTRGHEPVKETWKKILKGNDYEFDKRWRKVLHDGWLPESESDTEKYRQRKSIEDIIAQAPNTIPEPTAERLEIGFYESNLGDGRYANNGWLQELPDSVSKLAWDNAALLSPATAGALNVVNGDVVQLNAAGRTIESPVWIQPGVTDNTVSLWLGYGRSAAGRVGDNVGGDVYPLRTTDGMYFVTGASLTKTDRSRVLANTQDHSRMEGRPIVREASLDEYQEHPEFARDMVEHPPLKSIYPDYDYSRGYQW